MAGVCPPAIEAGVRAVFGFPLRVGAARLGALILWRDRPGPKDDDQHADVVMAGFAAQAVLVLQATAPPGRLGAELVAGGADFHYVVHQAAGMVATQPDLSVGQAFLRLKAYAFANDRLLADVAKDVVARALRFGPGSGNPLPGA
jgi:hypothetical protein